MGDDALVALWLHGRPTATVRAYEREVRRMRAAVGMPLGDVRLPDLQVWADGLAGDVATVARALSSVRSLFRFLVRGGYLAADPAAALRVPKPRDTLADRIITRAEMRKLLRGAAAGGERDVALVRLGYAGGFRASELCGLRRRDVAVQDDGSAYVTVLGKGGKTRTVRITADTWKVVDLAAAPNTGEDAPLFAGRTGGAMKPGTLWCIVRRAARRAGIAKPVSPHFLRHAHASHALERGAGVALVRDTLGHSSVAVTDRYLHARPDESSGRYLGV